MGKVLPFETFESRLERLSHQTPDAIRALTPDERRQQYEEHTMSVCRDLLTYYKKTTQWTPTCETHMITAVRSLKTLCHTLAANPIPDATEVTTHEETHSR